MAKQYFHPWNRWFRKKRFVLRHGVDFTSMPHCMAVQVRNQAIKRGKRASIVTTPDGDLVVNLLPKKRRRK